MRTAPLVLALLAVVAGCAEKDTPAARPAAEPAASEPAAPAAAAAAPADTATATTPPAAAPTIATTPAAPPAPQPTYHLDDATVDYDLGRRNPPARKGKSIELVLRSTPPGAIAAVDGEPVGPTPTYWAGETNGRPREFTFVLPGYATARYRFVPTQSGVVHGSLDRLKAPESDAGP